VPCERVADLENCIGEAVKNAVRFAPDATGIVVCVSCWPGRYRWVVINDGGCWFDVAAVLAREADTKAIRNQLQWTGAAVALAWAVFQWLTANFNIFGH
jgi:anti-sigma regulatory factor (Ser/Thr protein kinase)